MTTTLILIAVGFVLFSMQYGWWRSTVGYQYPRILMYHMVNNHVPRARFNKLRVTPDEFERQLKWLSQNQWSFKFVSELSGSTDRNCVALTFDDGYRDNLLHADPLLEKYGGKATLYLVADRHDRDWSSYKKQHQNSGELAAEPKLLDEDVANLIASGRWELASHTITHANLLNTDDSTRKKEIGSCKRILEEKFGTVVSSFAYPFGFYQRDDVECVASEGYDTAVTTIQGITRDLHADALQLKRVKISGADGMLAFKIRMRTGKCRWKD